MRDLNKTNMFSSNNDSSLAKELFEARKDVDFDNYLRGIHVSNEVLMRYTTRLQTSFNECKNCSTCKGIDNCKNEVFGFKLEPSVLDNKLKFEYKACKYKLKLIEDEKNNENVYAFDIPKEIRNAKMKDIFLDDKSRKETIAWLTSFIKSYDESKKQKGLYLNGNFGCGKTYLIAAAFNELSKKNIKSAIIYWPEFLRNLKSSFDDGFKEKFEYIKKVKLLLIDDIGAENVTAWGRDEILGTILQYRMEEGLTTFFTSNLNYDELETAISLSKGKIDSLKAARIIERIKNLTTNITMIAENKRD